MAIDKAIDSVKLESDLTSIADAIREKGGTSEQLAFPAGFVSAIGAISAGGVRFHMEEIIPDADKTTSNMHAAYPLDLDDPPSLYIVYSEFSSSQLASSSTGHLAGVFRYAGTSGGKASYESAVWAYNSSNYTQYAPGVYTITSDVFRLAPPSMNVYLRSGVKYKILFLWGVSW